MTSTFLSSLILPSFVAAFVGFIFFIYAFRINKKAHVNFIRIGVLLIGQFILLITSTLITGSNEDKRSRLQLKGFLDNNNMRITVDGKLLDSVKTKELSAALSSIADLHAHHSHPINTLRIQIISGHDTFNLTLGRDSEIETEYWVFLDKYMATEIGRISTKLDIKNGL